MNRRHLVATIVIAVTTTYFGSTWAIAAPRILVDTNVRLISQAGPASNYFLGTGTPELSWADGSGAFLRFDASRLTLFTQFADEGFELFIVEPGDRLTRKSVLDNQFQSLAAGDYQHNGQAFFLGISAPSRHWENQPSVDARVQEFGWAHLQPEGDELKMLSNVMTYESPGVIVGTATLVPEPSAFLIAAYGLGMASFRLRRPHPHPLSHRSIMHQLAGTTFSKRVKCDCQAITALHART